ncbi:MAG: iron-siderophore ABC transporter substrate-binding protein [Phormidesmis sp.]
MFLRPRLRWLRWVCLFSVTLYLTVACGVTSSQQPSVSSERPVASQADCRQVQHAMGETCVPVDPQRVITLDPGSLGNAIALGIQPIGGVTLGNTLPDYLQDKATELELLGHPNQPSLEKITRVRPDLILTDTRADLYEQFQAIAPTVASEDWLEPEPEPLWKRDLKLHGEALNKSEQVQQLLSDYDRRTRDFQQQMGDRLPQTQVSVVNFRADHARIYLKDSFIGTILQDAGLPRAIAQDKPGFVERISLETIPQLDADVMFLIVSDPDEPKILDQFINSPLWAQLNVVQQDRVYLVSADTWINGWNILGVQQVLDDLFNHLMSGTADA